MSHSTRLRIANWATWGLLLGGISLALPACGGGDQPPPTFTTIKPLIMTTCALSTSCHQQAPGMGNLSLAAADAYCALVGQTQGATYLSTAKTQYPRRVVPGNKGMSFLYKKLTLKGTDPALGTVMPYGQPLDQQYIDQFGSWIDGGAKDDNGGMAPGSCK